MTDEELKSIEQTTALLVENGFVIKDTASFIREIGNGNLEEVISKLGRLQVSINEGVNAEVFGKDLAVSLDGIEEVVNKDTYFKTSSEAASFENLLNDLREKSSRLFRNTMKAEEILKGREENLKDIEKRIADLKVDKTMDDVTRTSETIKLSYALNHAKQAKEDALKFYNDQKALSEKPLSADDIVEYKNDLLQAVNALDNAFRKLSMEPAAMDKLASLIRDTRDKIVLFGFETQKNQKEFDSLCAKYGLEKTNAKTIEKVETKEETEELSENKDEVVTPSEIVEPEKSEEPAEKEPSNVVITDVKDLFDEIIRLNPTVNATDIVYNIDGYPEKIRAWEPEKLVLPEGFKYSEELGINNKVDDTKPYISAFVDKKGKKIDIGDGVKVTYYEDVAQMILKANPNSSIESRSHGDITSINIEVDDLNKLVLPEGFEFDNNYHEVMEKTDKDLIGTSVFVKQREKKETKSSKVPSGKIPVKKTRRAVVAPYVKAILCYGGIGCVATMAAGIGAAPILAASIVGAGIGAIGQSIYGKMVKFGVVDAPNPNEYYNNKNYELPVFGSDILKHAKGLLSSLRNHKNKRKEETLDKTPEQEKVETPEVTEVPEVAKATEMTEAPVVAETPEVSEELNTEEKKPSLFENFKDLFKSNLDKGVSEVEQTEEKKMEETPEVLNSENKQTDFPGVLPEQYWLEDENLNHGGR